MITVTQLKEASDTQFEDLNRLSQSLHEDGRQGSKEEIDVILANPSIALIVAKDGEHIIGMGTLYMLPKIGRLSSYIEDVIVDETYRGQGLGEKIVLELIEVARTRGAHSITLTSRPEREAAHKLYIKLGFKKRDTTVFRLPLS